MWKHILEITAANIPEELTDRSGLAASWLRLVAEAAILAAFVLTSSWLVR